MNGHQERIADAVVRERKARSWSREVLAVRAGVSRNTVERIEKAQNVHRASSVAILGALGLDDDGQPANELDFSVLAKGQLSDADRRILRDLIERNRK